MTTRQALTYVEIDVPEWIPVQVLLNFNDTNCPPVLTDQNTVGQEHIWTASGNAFIDSSDVKFGFGALKLDGTGDFSTTPDSSDFTLGASDWTIDCWFKCTAAGGTFKDLAGQRDAALTATLSAWTLGRTDTNKIRLETFVGATSPSIVGTTSFSSGNSPETWHHLAAVRSGGTLYLFVDGIIEGTTSISGSINDVTAKLAVGTIGDYTGNPWLGSIDAFRMTIGFARWTANFTPPTSEPTGLTTYRFAINNDYLPTDIDAVPSITDVQFNPAILSLGEDLGQRASVSVKFRDHKHSFFGESFNSGTFWGKFRARYGAKLTGRTLRLRQGFVGQTLNGMETRTFVIDSSDGPDGDGTFQITAKDLFTLADGDKAQAPAPNSGFLSAGITNAATTLTVNPVGVGDLEYAASGFLNLSGVEIVSFTRSGDTFTITRAQFNTTAVAHNAQARAQQCVRYNVQDVANIIYDLLVNYCGIPAALIPLSNWLLETSTYLATTYTALIAEPTSVNKLISELIEQAGLVLWWDALAGVFKLQVLRAIASSAQVYDPNYLMEGTLSVEEQPDKRLSQIFIYFDKINPCISEDQLNNYRSTAMAISSRSEHEYGSPSIRKILSRWIPTGGRAFADKASTILLSRFADPPRRLSFNIFRDESGSIPFLGAGYQVQSWCFQDNTGAAALVPVQLTSVKPGMDHFEVEAEEVIVAPTTPVSPDVHTVIFDASLNNVNLRTVHDGLYASVVSGDTVNVFVNAGVIIGSTSTANPAMDVGSWPAGVTVNLTISGRIQGRGGNGGDGDLAGSGGHAGFPGGTALFLRRAVNLSGGGAIWGGGGGGGGGTVGLFAGNQIGGGGGGGGAGTTPGTHGLGNNSFGAFDGSDGTATTGGSGGTTTVHPAGVGGAGGGPGLAGAQANNNNLGGAGYAGGAAGNSIDGNSNITGSVSDRRGPTIN